MRFSLEYLTQIDNYVLTETEEFERETIDLAKDYCVSFLNNRSVPKNLRADLYVFNEETSKWDRMPLTARRI